MTRGEYLTLTFVLAGLAGLQPLATETSLPAVPAIAAGFGVSGALVQYTLSAQLAGVACGQLIVGPLSDRFGRKPIILGGLVLFTAAAFWCASATTVDELFVARFLIGFALCAGQILSRAVIRDHFDREEGARLLAYMLTVFGIFPIFTPVLGGLLTREFGWESVFWFLAIYGVAIFAAVWLLLPESIGERNPNSLRPRVLVGSYATIVRNRVFLGYLSGAAVGYVGLFGFLLGAPVVLTGHGGLAIDEFGYVMGVTLGGFVVPQFIAGRVVGRFGIDRLLVVGSIVTGISGIMVALLAWAGFDSPFAICVPMFFYLGGLAFVIPQSTAGALSPFPHIAGAAASMMGFLLFCWGVAGGTLVAMRDDGTQIPMTNIIGATGAAMLVALVVFVLPRLHRKV